MGTFFGVHDLIQEKSYKIHQICTTFALALFLMPRLHRGIFSRTVSNTRTYVSSINFYIGVSTKWKHIYEMCVSSIRYEDVKFVAGKP